MRKQKTPVCLPHGIVTSTVGKPVRPGACPAVKHAAVSLGRPWSVGHPTPDIADVVLEKEFAFVRFWVLLLVF